MHSCVLWILIQLRIGTIQALSSKEHIRFFGSCCNAGVFTTQGFAAPTSARTAACSMKLVKKKAVLVKMTDFICMGFGFHPQKNARGLGANHSRALVPFQQLSWRSKAQKPSTARRISWWETNDFATLVFMMPTGAAFWTQKTQPCWTQVGSTTGKGLYRMLWQQAIGKKKTAKRLILQRQSLVWNQGSLQVLGTGRLEVMEKIMIFFRWQVSQLSPPENCCGLRPCSRSWLKPRITEKLCSARACWKVAPRPVLHKVGFT